MQALVVYDSYFGNTERVARAIATGLSRAADVRIAKLDEVTPADMKGVDVLVMGSPTRAFRPSDGTRAFLRDLPAASLAGVRVAAFDTRVDVADVDNPILTPMVRVFGYAAEPIARRLVRRGGTPLDRPEGFIVEGTEGPLRDGELERAEAWGTTLAEQVAPEAVAAPASAAV